MKKNTFLLLLTSILLILPLLVSALPGGTPPSGNVDPTFNTLQITDSATIGNSFTVMGDLFTGGIIKNAKNGIHPVVFNDDDGTVIESGSFNVKTNITNSTAAALTFSDPDGTFLNSLYINKDAKIENSIAGRAVAISDADGFEVSAGPLTVLNIIRNTTFGAKVKIDDSNGLDVTGPISNSTEALVLDDEVHVSGHLKAASVGAFVHHVGNPVTIAQNTAGTASRSCLDGTMVSCGYSRSPIGTTPLNVYFMDISGGNTCMVMAFNNTSAAVSLTSYATCFVPNM